MLLYLFRYSLGFVNFLPLPLHKPERIAIFANIFSKSTIGQAWSCILNYFGNYQRVLRLPHNGVFCKPLCIMCFNCLHEID